MKISITIENTDEGIRVSHTIGKSGGIDIYDSFPEAMIALIHTYESERMKQMFNKENAA